MDAEALKISQWNAYPGEAEYLTDQLTRLDLLIRLQLDSIDADKSTNQELSGLVITKNAIEHCLPGTESHQSTEDVHSGDKHKETLHRLHNATGRINGRVSQSWKVGIPPALEWIVAQFRLTPFEKDVLIVLAAPEVHRKYDRLYAYLQDDVTQRRPSVDLVLQLLCQNLEESITGQSFFQTSSSLLRMGLIRFIDEESRSTRPLLSRSLKLEDRIVNFILHRELTDPQYESVISHIQSYNGVQELALDETCKCCLRNIVTRYREMQCGHENGTQDSFPQFLCLIEGPHGVGKKQAAAAVCQDLGISLLVADLPLLAKQNQCTERVLRDLTREAVLNNSAILFSGIEYFYKNDNQSVLSLCAIDKTITKIPGLVFMATCKPGVSEPGRKKPLIRVTLPRQNYDLRKTIWQSTLAEASIKVNTSDIEELANQFQFTRGQIEDAVRQLTYLNIVENNSSTEVRRELVYRACREQNSSKLGELAKKITPVYTWDDIIISAERLAQLKEMCDQVRLHHAVLETWGFGKKLQRGQGLSALYSGPSGTGKSMAAEIIASDLGLDLYKVDLSSIVSKYIGETEKNLSHVFDEAEQSNSILFFDEADALFGKRTEVKDSHDRYANIEVNYLLQRIEEYSGIAILATNMRGHLDGAFTRRLRISIDFPFPESKHREQIWKKVFPAEAPLSKDINLMFLAERFKLSGGNIKNAALTGAFAAAKEKQQITMKHIIFGIKREFQKIGKLCTKSDFGKYFPLVAEEASL